MRHGFQTRHSFDFLFVLLTFAFFFIIGMLLISMGSGAYHRVLDDMHANDEERTAVSYLSQKLRQSRREGGVTTGSFGGTQALILHEELDGKQYCTYLYVFDGSLRELMTEEGNHDFSLSSGMKILELKKMELRQWDADTLRIVLTLPSGKETTVEAALLP